MDIQTQNKVAEFFTNRYKSQFVQTFGTSNQEAETLTFETILEATRNLDLIGSGPGRINRPALTQPLFPAQLKIITSDLLTVSTPKPLSLFERFRVWVESLADRAEVYYHYPRVQRFIVKPSTEVYLIGGNTLVCHPAVYFQIRQKWDSQLVSNTSDR